jgi:1-acyl-sn-glycerol-3-phosphate acyltransferase
MRSTLRMTFRLGRAGLHLAWAVGVAAIAYPLIGDALRRKLKQRWSRQLLSMLGVRLDAAWQAGPLRGLLVANHISWLDIYVINALSPAVFICKAEVRAWPVIGWLCAKTGTVFIERGSASAARRANEALTGHLGSNRVVAAFPEGTTSDGMALLPFRSALLQAAIDAQSVVQPIALSYLDATGRRTPVAAYCGDVTLWQSLCDIASAPGLTVRAEVLPPLSSLGRTRRELGEHAQHLIGTALGRLAPSCAAHGAGALASPVEALA